MNTAPCMNCKDRKVGCHSKCQRYKEYDKKNEERRKARLDACRNGMKIWKRK